MTHREQRSDGDVGDGAGLVDALHDAGDDLVGPNLVALLKALADQRLHGRLPLDWRRHLQQGLASRSDNW